MENKATSTAKKAVENVTSMITGEKTKKTLKDLLTDGLKDIYSAEKQLVEALPKMVKAADSEELADAFEHHLQQTHKHVSRLEKIFNRLNLNKGSEKCEAMEGLIKEAQEIIDNYEESPVRDSALIIAAQKVEHYEIASYGSLCELADVLGLNKVAEILDRTLEEEEETDLLLTDIAEEINDEACEISEDQDRSAE